MKRTLIIVTIVVWVVALGKPAVAGIADSPLPVVDCGEQCDGAQQGTCRFGCVAPGNANECRCIPCTSNVMCNNGDTLYNRSQDDDCFYNVCQPTDPAADASGCVANGGTEVNGAPCAGGSCSSGVCQLD